jgi:transcriptional regulator with XRE-family HTH domain
MQPAPPAALQLASRLKQLRQQQSRLTQAELAAALSKEGKLAPVTVSSWESLKSPKPPPVERLRAYARFFATPRSVEGQPKLLPFNDLTQDEKKECEKLETELLRLRSAASGESTQEEPTFNRSWLFRDGAPVTFVCAPLPKQMIGPLGNPGDPNYTELQTYADIGALIELFGHIRAENPATTVHFKTPDDVQPDELTGGHVILLGGVVWNEITGRLSEMANLPVKQVKDPPLASGEIFTADVEGEERQFWPKWADENKKVLMEDVGLLARVPNPLNANRTLTICNGIHSRGVYGAVRTLTDAAMREGNEKYISTKFGDTRSFAILMSVKVLKGKAMTPDFNSPDVVLFQWAQGAA